MDVVDCLDDYLFKNTDRNTNTNGNTDRNTNTYRNGFTKDIKGRVMCGCC